MTVYRWDPFADLASVRRDMSRLLDDTRIPVRGSSELHRESRVLGLPLDAYVTSQEVVITAAVPGLDPDEVEVALQGDTLTIRGEFRRPLENVEYIFQERPYGVFQRSVKINIGIDPDRAEASFDKGILTIILPKSAPARSRTIEVKPG